MVWWPFEKKPRSVATFGIRYHNVKDLKLHPENIAKFQFPETPPWTLTPVNINLELAHTKRGETNPAFYQAAHKEILEHFPGYNLLYTNGSVSNITAACAAVLGDEAVTLRLPEKSSIFTTELIIFSDSKSASWALRPKD